MRRNRPWLAVILALSVIDGCNCGKKGESNIVGEVGVPAAPAELNFGNVAVGQSSHLQLQVGNTGAGTLDLSGQTISGPPFTETTHFLVSTLAPGAKTNAVITFAPTVAGPASGTFTIGDDGDPQQVKVALVGTGLDLAVSVTPASLAFGQVPVSTSAPTQTVTFTNTTASPVYATINTSATATEYTVDDATMHAVTATPVQLAPNVPYVLTVGFTPDQVSIFDSSFTYTICQDATTAECLMPQSVTLTGQGVSGQLSLTPSPIVFSNVPDGTSASQTITVTNIGAATADVTCLYLSSVGTSAACGTASASFTLGAPSIPLPVTLDGGGSFTFSLTYLSTGTAPVTDVLNAAYIPQGLTVSSIASDNITGSETPSPCTLSLSPSSLSFTYTSAGVPVDETLTINNTGGSTCQITGIALDPSSDPGYTLVSGQALALSIAAGANATIGVAFELAANTPPNTRLGHLDFASNDPAHASVAVPLIASVTSPYAGGGAWPRWHHDNIQSGLSANDTSGLVGTIAWTANVSATTSNFFTMVPTDYMNSPVVGADGTIFQLGMNGTLYAFNADGSAKWTIALEGPVSDSHVGTPIIASDGSLFVAFGDTVQPTEEGAANLPNGLFHVSATGTIISSIAPSGGGDGFDLPPLLTNGGLLLGADDSSWQGEYAGAFAYSIGTTGTVTIVDSAKINNDYDQISAVVGPDDTTYWCGGGACNALTPPPAFKMATGWPTTPGNTQSSTSDLALDEFFTGNLMVLMGGWVANDQTFSGVPDLSTSQQLLSVVPSTGKVAWTFKLPAPNAAQKESNYGGFADATVGNSCPAIGTDGTVYVGNFDGLHAINGTTGVENPGWPFLTSGDDVLTAPAIGGDGTIFFGTAGGTFYAVTPAGALRFKVSAGGRIAGSPAIGPNGNVYFTANDGNLYAVQ